MVVTEAEPSDDRLLAAARAGDRHALEILLERHQAQVYRFGVRMCRDSEDAKDVLQDTLLAMARGAQPAHRDHVRGSGVFWESSGATQAASITDRVREDLHREGAHSPCTSVD